jgi:hypothetical protein
VGRPRGTDVVGDVLPLRERRTHEPTNDTNLW